MEAGLSASECPVCFEKLGENRKPYSLSCGHTLCRICVFSLLSRGSTELSCPLCRTVVKKTSIKLNVALYHLLGQLRAGPLLHSPQTLDISFDDLQLGRMLDRGAFGEVYRAKWRGNEVAVKVFSAGQLSPEAQDAFKREVFVMNCLRHPNIVLLMGACHTLPHLAIIMEFLVGGSLYSLLHIQKHRPKMEDIVSLAGDVCKGLQYLHSINILHRDLKSKNVLLTGLLPCQAKLCDFGMARMRLESATMTGNVGTVHWTAPEVLNCARYRFSADIYSFGMVLYELVTGNIPFGSLPPAVVIVSVLMKREQPKLIEPTHPMLVELIRGCTKWEPKERPSIPTILTHLTSLLPEPPEEEQQEQEELSHTDSLGHVFLSIGEEDVDILEFLRAEEEEGGFTDSVTSAGAVGGGLVSQSDLDQFYQQTEANEEHTSLNDVPFAEAEPNVSLKSPLNISRPPLQKSPLYAKSKKAPVTYPIKMKLHTAAAPVTYPNMMKLHKAAPPLAKQHKDTDLELAQVLMKEEQKQQELADYLLAKQIQSEENVIRVPASQRPLPHRRGASIPRPPPLPLIRHSFTPQLHTITPMQLLHTQIKKATSRLSKKKLKPVKTVEKRAFPMGRVVDGANSEYPSHSVNREIESFSKRWLKHVASPRLKPAAPVGRVLPYRHSAYVKPIIKRLNSEVLHFNKDWLSHSDTVVHSYLPTQQDILEERGLSAGVPPDVRPMLWRLNSEVRRFDHSFLNPVQTVVRDQLPTQQDILEERQAQPPED